MIQITSISAETPSKLNLRVNDWLKGWPDERILGIDFLYRKDLLEPYLAFITYTK